MSLAKYPQPIAHSLKLLRHSLTTPVTNLLFNLESVLNFKDQHKSNYQFHLQQAWLSAKYLRPLMVNIDNPRLNQSFKIKPALLEVLNLTKQPDVRGQLIQFIKISDCLCLRGNRFYFQESLICLLNNAFEAYQSSAENKLVIISCEKQQQELIIKVVDGAQGFNSPNQDQLSLFKLNDSVPSWKTSKPNHLGYGLKFVHYVVTSHFKGFVKLNNYQGRGAAICCYFPLEFQQ